MQKIYIIVVLVLLLNSCAKSDFRDHVVGSYSVVKETWQCVDSNLNYVGPHVISTSNTVLTVEKYGNYGLKFSNIPWPVEQLTTSSASFQGVYPAGSFLTRIGYLDQDSISIFHGREIGCRGSDVYYHYYGKN